MLSRHFTLKTLRQLPTKKFYQHQTAFASPGILFLQARQTQRRQQAALLLRFMQTTTGNWP
ncbi:MAG TPA: hypothetical protein DD391_08285 [Clostridiales bacterium]|nr:hypothetical protein [Clostridiales bacterium]